MNRDRHFPRKLAHHIATPQSGSHEPKVVVLQSAPLPSLRGRIPWSSVSPQRRASRSQAAHRRQEGQALTRRVEVRNDPRRGRRSSTRRSSTTSSSRSTRRPSPGRAWPSSTPSSPTRSSSSCGTSWSSGPYAERPRQHRRSPASTPTTTARRMTQIKLRSGIQRYFFFFGNHLWKVYDVHKLGKKSKMGADYDAAVERSRSSSASHRACARPIRAAGRSSIRRTGQDKETIIRLSDRRRRHRGARVHRSKDRRAPRSVPHEQGPRHDELDRDVSDVTKPR